MASRPFSFRGRSRNSRPPRAATLGSHGFWFPPWGWGGRVEGFVKVQGGCISQCWAVGDDLSDLAMLEAVGRSVAVGTGTPLARLARERGWVVLEGAATLACAICHFQKITSQHSLDSVGSEWHRVIGD